MTLSRVAEEYLASRPANERLVNLVSEILRARLSERGLRSEVTGRVKEVGSFLRKVLKKGYRDPMREITDKAGARVLVPFQSLVPPVGDVVHANFTVLVDEDKGLELDEDRFGYLGRHLLVRLLDRDIPDLELAGLICEIQIHTRAQNAWSEPEHDLAYKPFVPTPPGMKRRLRRLVALVELFDAEMDRARAELASQPGFDEGVMLDSLEKLFIPIARRDYDRELSLLVLATVRRAYDDAEYADIDRILRSFTTANVEKLAEIYRDYAGDDRAPWVSQPETIAVFERLEAKPNLLSSKWRESLPLDVLDQLANCWGSPLELSEV